MTLLNNKAEEKRLLEETLVDELLQGSQTALARLITLVENQPTAMVRVLPLLQRKLGLAYCVGFTGPPGAGKSTLVSKVTKVLREQQKKVGIIAIDPTSPFTGGAFLGDRIRMQEMGLDSGVFIRSMATRGSWGGLAQATKNVVKLMDAGGFDYILVETVGVGQTELDVRNATDMTVVVLVPEGGDGVQAMKAGLMEIGDIFVVNKADRPGAENLSNQVRGVLELNPQYKAKRPPVLLTQGIDGAGVPELVAVIQQAQAEVDREELELRRQERRMMEFEEMIKWYVVEKWHRGRESNPRLRTIFHQVEDGRQDPYSALREMFPDSWFN